jgi:hypothetical protein
VCTGGVPIVSERVKVRQRKRTGDETGQPQSFTGPNVAEARGLLESLEGAGLHKLNDAEAVALVEQLRQDRQR